MKTRPPAEPIQQRPRPGGTRCPFCHEECEATPEACACAECLSRHHRGCWEEGGGCSSCRATDRLEAPGTGEVVAPAYAATISAWLKLGGVYNAVLLLWTVALLAASPLLLGGAASEFLLFEVGVGALLANLCFLLGPAIELAAVHLGHRGKLLRWFLFLPGLLFALLLTLLSLLTY